MFRFKLIVITVLMVSCGKTPTKESLIEDECENTNHHIEVVSKTDSILSVADKKIDKIKEHQLKQKGFVDSLEHTIVYEQNTINNINKKLNDKLDIEKSLIETNKELKELSLNNKVKIDKLEYINDKRERELMELNSLLDMKVRNYMNKLLFYKEREIDLINYYEHQIDSLVSVIDSLPKNKVKKIRK